MFAPAAAFGRELPPLCLTSAHPNCKLVWARGTKSATGTDQATGRSVSPAAGGGTVVAAGIWGTTTFGSGEPSEKTVSASQAALAKYSATGSFEWVKSISASDSPSGASAASYVLDIATRSDGTFYVAGGYRGQATFGVAEATETTLTSPARRIFVARYNSDGSLAWAERAGSDLNPKYESFPGNDAWAAAVAIDGDLLVTGSFIGTATFGEGQPNQATLLSSTGQDLQCMPAPTADIFLARYHPDGTLAWAKRAGGKGNCDVAYGVAAASDGGAVVVGSCGLDWCNDPSLGPATFGPGESLQTDLPCSYFGDMFVARYAKDGSLVWVRRAASLSKSSDATDVGILPDGSFAIGGFSSGLTFAPGEASETTISDTGRFLARYDASGGFQWVKLVGPPQLDFHVRVGAGGVLAMAGSFGGTTTFFPNEPSAASLISAGAGDVWFSRFAP